MKQLSFLAPSSNSAWSDGMNKRPLKMWQLFIDGASRNNPGPAGAGVYLKNEDQDILKQGYFLGSKSNNQAEYLALLLGLYFIQQQNISSDMCLAIYSDSQLLVRQINGQYQVKDHVLQKYHKVALQILVGYVYNVHHVLREKNAIADALANEGINHSVPLPESFVTMMHRYEIML